MLKIIPTSTEKVLYTLPGKRWKEFRAYQYGIYFEYFENDLINFKFFYALEKISILDGPFSSKFSLDEMTSFFDCCVDLSELWEWIDQIPFKIIDCLNIYDETISEIWKMTEIIDLDYFDEKVKTSLLQYYFEFQVSTSLIRSLPYRCNRFTSFIEIDVSEEKDKIYWITLCLLRYQKQLN